jgi:hypothetical protein
MKEENRPPALQGDLHLAGRGASRERHIRQQRCGPVGGEPSRVEVERSTVSAGVDEVAQDLCETHEALGTDAWRIGSALVHFVRIG